MRKILKSVAPAVVLVAGIGAVWALTAAKPDPEKTEEIPRPVSLYVDTVRAESVVLSVRTQGEVRPKTDVNIIPQVSGRITYVDPAFSEGGSFAPGTVLLRIDDSDYKLELIRAEARVAEARVQVEQELADARIKEKQWQEWVKDGEPTPLALNKPQVAEAQAKLRAAEADLKEARLNMERTRISLPFDGRVRSRDVGLGQFVSNGTVLGRAFATDVVEIKLPLTDKQLTELQLPIGYVAMDPTTAPGVTFTHDMGGMPYQWRGRIVRINADIDQQTRLAYAIAEVDDPYGRNTDRGMPFAVGMFVHAEIAGAQPQRALVMPRLALRSDNRVFVINAENKLEIRTVGVLATSPDRVLVSSGVVDGEKVVTSPVQSAVAGMIVQPITRAAATNLSRANTAPMTADSGIAAGSR